MTKLIKRPRGRPRKPKPTRSPPRRDANSPQAATRRRLWAEASPEKRAAWTAAIAESTRRRAESQDPSNWRTGIPHAMRRDEAEAEWAFARMYAKEVTKIMVDEKMLPEDPKVEKAFTAAVEVLESPMSQAIKLQAARLILDFCKAKPVAKSEVTVKSAEDWLAQVTADHLTKTEVKNEG
jgi:hypothetical protein